ncbi:hypothetical protein KC19_2G285100 [Ceratodon purpureus]|uniref:Uncharacterized protein n=1 Tax=Ceratodon purpureus TaxID=3225 RepID=A0A8T0J0H1_CERPU|nr:hypothetical protein KC19_2G285100 [Ceratodon purpureus]
MATWRGEAMVLMALLVVMVAATGGHAVESDLTRVIVIDYLNKLDFDVRVTISNPELLGHGVTVNDIPAHGTLVTKVELAVATSTDFRFTVRKQPGGGPGDVTYITAGPTVPKALSSSGVRVIIKSELCIAPNGAQGLAVRLTPEPLGLNYVDLGAAASELCLQKAST